METNQTSSSKRKPLSDLTNAITSVSGLRKLAKSSIPIAGSQNPKPPKSSISILPDSTQSKTLKSSISIPFNQIYKPPKSSISIAPNSKTLKSSISKAKPPKVSVSIPAVPFKPSKSSISIAAGDENPGSLATSSSPGSLLSSGSTCSSPDSWAPPSLSDIGDHERSWIPISQDQRQDAKSRMDKGKMVVDTQELSSSAASGNDHLFEPDTIQNENLNARPQKDKGKMVFEAPSIRASDPVTPHAGLLVSSSSASDEIHDGRQGHPVSQSLELDAETRIDKGKAVMETPIIQIPKPFTPLTLQLSASAASGSSYHSTHDVTQSEGLDSQPQKDKGKIVLEDLDIETSDPATPVAAQLLSSSSASGVQDKEKTNSTTVYSQRRYSLRRQHVAPTSAPLSRPRKKMKLKGVEFIDRSDQRTGSHTDPLPLHKKKQSRKKNDDVMHGMPQDEVERLKSYYADIDAFELPEEVASDSD